MTLDPLLAILLAAVVVAAGLFAIHRWGPGRSRRWVHCPEKDRDAQVLVERKEGSFAALLPPDVVTCSLLPEGKVDCDQECLHR